MTIKLIREDALVIKITDAINSAKVDYNKYVSLSKDVLIKDEDELQPSSEDKLYRYVGNMGLRGFVQSEINERLLKVYPFDSAQKAKPLRDLNEFANPVAVAREIVARLKGLPERYRLTIPLSPQFSAPLLPNVASVRLGEHAAVCKAEKLPELSMKSENSFVDEALFSDPFSNSLNTDRTLSSELLYFTSVELGYIPTGRSSIVAEHFLDKNRALYGAMTAMGVTSERFKSVQGKKQFALAHMHSGSADILSTVETPDDLWDRRWYQDTEAFVNAAGDKPSAIKSAFERVSLILSDDDFAQRAMTACIWYYRALNSSNSLDRILHATIAIEVLVGDKETADSVGLTKLLGNRCAYLLGRTRLSRQKIVDEFVEIYRVRSAIVHGGKHKMEKKDRHAASASLKLCASVIAKELELHQAQDLNSAV
jgi:hypothetical protein